MNIEWSDYARSHYRKIIFDIAFALSAEDAIRWEGKLDDAVAPLADFPDCGQKARESEFLYLPEHFERLRTITCNPYVILYEHVDDECHILDIHHGRQLFDGRFTYWR